MNATKPFEDELPEDELFEGTLIEAFASEVPDTVGLEVDVFAAAAAILAELSAVQTEVEPKQAEGVEIV